MKWIIDNWSLLVVLACVVVAVVIYVRKFVNMPTEDQVAKVKEWLLFAVVQAEKELGGGTGAIKLRYTYDLFVATFPDIAKIISFELFSKWVDEVLVQMRHLLETNVNIAYYVEKNNE